MVSEKKTSVALKAISYIAKKKANAACLGFAYEPDVPEKLKSMMDTREKRKELICSVFYENKRMKEWE